MTPGRPETAGRSPFPKAAGRRRFIPGVLALIALAVFATVSCTDQPNVSQSQSDSSADERQPDPEANMTKTITGSITVEEDGSAPESALLKIRLLDTSSADASSITIIEQELVDVDLSASELPFRLEVPDDFEAVARYTVSVHADVDGSGDISVGDYITMESYPVTLDDSQPPLEVRIRLVRS